MIGVKGVLRALKTTFSNAVFSKSFAIESLGSSTAKKENYVDFADRRSINDVVCVAYPHPPYITCFKRDKNGLYTAI